jgi:alpha-galactosidase
MNGANGAAFLPVPRPSLLLHIFFAIAVSKEFTMHPISRREAGKILLAGYTGLLVSSRDALASESAADSARAEATDTAPEMATRHEVQKSATTPTAAQASHEAAADQNYGSGWSNVYLAEGPEPTISYRTSWVVYEESLHQGQFVGRGWNGAGFMNFYEGRIDPEDYAVPEAFRLEIDGQSLVTDWQWQGLEKKASGETDLHVTINLKNAIRPITVKVHTKLDGTPILTRWLEITNTSDRPAAVATASPWSGVLKQNERWRSHLSGSSLPLYSIGYFEDTVWGQEGNFQWHELPTAGYRIDGRFRRGRYRHPLFMVRNNATGEFFVGQFAWTGGYRFDFDLDPEIGKAGAAAGLTFEAGPDAFAPMRVIAPGETIITPEMHLGLVFGGLDNAVQAMHTHLRQSVFLPQTVGRGGLVESGIGPEIEITTDQVNHSIDVAAEIGADVFFIDASWYASPGSNWWATVGDWTVNTQRFPQGLMPFRDRVRAAGMLWGLWMDAERIGDSSRVAKEHPDWLAMNYNGDRKMGGQLDVTNPDAAKWMESQIIQLIETYKLDFFRLDYNTDPHRGIKRLQNGFVENGYWRYYDTLYGVYSRLRERFPHVVFENCAGGGGRTDIGMVQWFHHTDVTDWQIAPRSFMITNGMTMALPPERVDRLLGGQAGQTAADFDFQSRLLLFTEPKFGFLYPLGAESNPVLAARAKHWISLYKNFVRPFVSSSRIYHHTPVVSGLEPNGWGVLELASADRNRDICGIFQLSAPVSDEYLVRPRGLDVSKRYRVTFDNLSETTVVDGYTLVEQGIPIRLPGALTSELLVFEAA